MSGPSTYASKPKFVQALQWTGDNLQEVKDWVCYIGDRIPSFLSVGTDTLALWVDKSNTVLPFKVGTWIIAESDGIGYYPCVDDSFRKSYVV